MVEFPHQFSRFSGLAVPVGWLQKSILGNEIVPLIVDLEFELTKYLASLRGVIWRLFAYMRCILSALGGREDKSPL